MNNCFKALEKLEEESIFNSHDTKNIQKNIYRVIEKYTSKYKKLLESAKERDSEKQILKYEYVLSLLDSYIANSEKTIEALYIMISSFAVLEDKESREFIYKNMPASKNRYTPQVLFAIRGIRDDLLSIFEGFNVTRKRLLKSYAIKLYIFIKDFEELSDSKAKEITETLFAKHGEKVTIDTRRANHQKIIGTYKCVPMLGYKGLQNDSEELINHIIEIAGSTSKGLIGELRKNGRKDLAKRAIKNIRTIQDSTFLSIYLD